VRQRLLNVSVSRGEDSNVTLTRAALPKGAARGVLPAAKSLRVYIGIDILLM